MGFRRRHAGAQIRTRCKCREGGPRRTSVSGALMNFTLRHWFEKGVDSCCYRRWATFPQRPGYSASSATLPQSAAASTSAWTNSAASRPSASKTAETDPTLGIPGAVEMTATSNQIGFVPQNPDRPILASFRRIPIRLPFRLRLQLASFLNPAPKCQGETILVSLSSLKDSCKRTKLYLCSY